MQAAARTPTSILRRRADKENEDAGHRPKRNRLNRRVSFAPDEELETKHIFKEAESADMVMASPTVPLGLEVLQASFQAQQAQPLALPLAVPPSPQELSPLSMELTNNSNEQGHVGSTAAPAAGTTTNLMQQFAPDESARPMQQLPSRPVHHMEYTRNITVNLPNLSTLVEEDEEEYARGEVSGSRGPESSQPSPSLLRVMQQRGNGGRTSSPMWNHLPGAADTADLKGPDVMGETTFNHVYNSNTTGDFTRRFRDGVAEGTSHGRLGAITRPLALTRKPAAVLEPQLATGPDATVAAAAAAGPSAAVSAAMPGALRGMRSPQRPENPPTMCVPGVQPPQSAIQPALHPQDLRSNDLPVRPQRQQHFQQQQQQQLPGGPVQPGPGFLDNTTKLLMDDQTDQTNAWRLPPHGGSAYGRRQLSVAASNKLGGNAAFRRDVAGPGGAGETTMLLDPVTRQLGSDAGGQTLQLLADTAPASAYERLLGRAAPQPAPVQSVAPAPRRGAHVGGGFGYVPAVSSNAGDALARSGSQQDHTADMSLELQMNRGSMQANDLLGEGPGLSLDAFALPPEPGVSVAAGGKVAAYTEAVRSRPPITCEHFLELVDVSFDEKVCRASFLPQADPPPKTVAEVFEAAFITAGHVDVRQANSIELASKLSSMQAHARELEAELTNRNPSLFAEVQGANHTQLETIKEQVIMLKKLCRIRTLRAIKQTELAALCELTGKMEVTVTALQEEVAAATADADRLDKCVEAKAALADELARRVDEDEAQLQEAAQKRKRCEALHQRLQALRAQNQERERRLEERRAEQRAEERAQVPIEVLKRECASVEERLQALEARKMTSALTPGSESQLIRQVSRKRAEIAALMALHGLSINLSRFEQERTMSLVFRGTYDMVISSDREPTAPCNVKVSQRDDVAGSNGLSPSMVAMMGTTAAALSCTVPRSQLQLRLELIVQQLQRMASMAEQLEDCDLRHMNLMLPEVVVERRQPASTASAATAPAAAARAAADPGSGPELQLAFINVMTSTKVVIGMPWRDAIACDATAPTLRVEVHNLQAAELQRQACQALRDTVLSKLEPGPQYMRALCYTMSVTVG